MAEKDKTAAAVASTSETHVDFSALPPSALDNYIAYYDLAKGYPPPPSRRSPTPEQDEDEEMDEGADGEEGRGRRASSKNIEDGKTVTTATRLRPRSPTSSVSHLFPTGARRSAAGNGTGPGSETASLANGATGAEDVECPSHFFDAQEADWYLANAASKHFTSQPQPKEGEIVVQFLYRCRAGDKVLKVAS